MGLHFPSDTTHWGVPCAFLRSYYVRGTAQTRAPAVASRSWRVGVTLHRPVADSRLSVAFHASGSSAGDQSARVSIPLHSNPGRISPPRRFRSDQTIQWPAVERSARATTTTTGALFSSLANLQKKKSEIASVMWSGPRDICSPAMLTTLRNSLANYFKPPRAPSKRQPPGITKPEPFKRKRKNNYIET